ncbi:MAG: hypothetical protein HY898_33510 [Deltaproteobacteria bacterium]|nr:hypothetical protein [Deltaproteobacteria bacterium]
MPLKVDAYRSFWGAEEPACSDFDLSPGRARSVLNTKAAFVLTVAAAIALVGAAACGGGEFQAGGEADAATAESAAGTGTGGASGQGGSKVTGGQAGGMSGAGGATPAGGQAGAGSAASAAGAGGTPLQGGSAGAGGAQPDSGSEGAAAGSAGVAGAAGAGGAAFDVCYGSPDVPPTENDCSVAVCQARPDCCTVRWSLACALEARLLPTCNCAALECSASPYKAGISGACMSSAPCNPVNDTLCGPAAHCVLISLGDQIKTNCQTLGPIAACQHCDNQYSVCTEGHSCVAGRCVRLCCESGDCPTGTCTHQLLPAGIGAGVCVAQ